MILRIRCQSVDDNDSLGQKLQIVDNLIDTSISLTHVVTLNLKIYVQMAHPFQLIIWKRTHSISLFSVQPKAWQRISEVLEPLWPIWTTFARLCFSAGSWVQSWNTNGKVHWAKYEVRSPSSSLMSVHWLVGIWGDVITGIYHGRPNCRAGQGDHSSPPWWFG